MQIQNEYKMRAADAQFKQLPFRFQSIQFLNGIVFLGSFYIESIDKFTTFENV